MHSNRLHIAIFTVVLFLVGSIGIMTTSRKAGDLGSAVAAAQSAPSTTEVTPEDTAAVEAYFAEIEQQRNLDAYLAELNKIEQEKVAAAQRAANAPKAPRTEPNYDSGDGSRWDRLAQCEAGGNWATNTGNGFGGGLQFMHQRSYSTWLSYGGGEFAPHPWEASREQQIVIAERVLAGSGWKAWPGCSRKFGWL
jgi:hypothetical protein